MTDGHVMSINNYTWFGNNRKHIHRRARTGSGGVGLLVRDSFIERYDIDIVNNEHDGIIWIKCSEKGGMSNDCFYVCVVYLPPEFSARSVNAHEFFDTLMTQIYDIPDGRQFFPVRRLEQQNG